MATQQEVIKRFMAYLDTHTFNRTDFSSNEAFRTKILDSAIDYATSGSSRHFSTIKDAIVAMKADISSTNNADTFLKEYCGINLDNTDTGAITGLDAGGSTTKTATSIVPETKSASNFTGTSFTVNGLTVKLGKSNLSDYEQYIWNNLHEHWMKGGLDLIAKSYGDNFGFGSNSSATVKEITVTFFEDKGGAIANTSAVWNTGIYSDDYNGKTVTGLTLSINLAYYKTDSVNYADLDGKLNSEALSLLESSWKDGYLDRNIAHEMTHAIMYANINYFGLLPRFVAEGMAELTHGGDDLRKSDLKVLAANSSKLESALNGASSIEGVGNPAYSGGYMFLRWLAKQASDSGTVVDGVINNTVSNTSLTGSAKADNIKNSGSYVTISSGAGNDTITNFLKSGGGNGNYALINTGDGRDNVSINGSYYVSVNGGADNDTVTDNGGYKSYYNGGAGNDLISVKSSYWDFTLEGGTGNDTIISNTTKTLYNYNLNDGNDLIKGFNATSTLQIGGGTGTYSSQKSGSDIIVTVGTGKITLSGAASLSAVNIKGSLSSGSIFTEGNDNYNNSVSGVTLNVLGGNDTINNTGSNVVIYGGSGNDSIRNDYGNNVTINTGAGKDSVIAWGSNIKINDDSGDNYVYTYGAAKNVTVITGNGKDSVESAAKVASISTGSGNDFIKLYSNAENHTINTGDGKDSIYTGGQTVSVNAGSDNDYIHIYSNATKNTIIAGAGNDTINNRDSANVLFKYESGDGNDLIKGFDSTSTLSISGAAFSKTKSSNNKDWLVKVGNNTITLQGAASLTSPNIVSDYKPSSFTEGNDNYNNTVSGVTLNALGGNDTITNSGSKVTIYGGAGNDSIKNYATSKVTISGGSGADAIINYGAAASLVGGTGNDVIWGDSGKDTIRGGSGKDKLHGDAGNDRIYGDAGNDSLWGGAGNDSLWGGSGKDVFIYKPGEGTDRIFDYASGDMLKILQADGSEGGSFTKSKFSGGDLTLTISGGGKVIFDGVSSGDKFNINGKTYTLSGTKLK